MADALSVEREAVQEAVEVVVADPDMGFGEGGAVPRGVATCVRGERHSIGGGRGDCGEGWGVLSEKVR